MSEELPKTHSSEAALWRPKLFKRPQQRPTALYLVRSHPGDGGEQRVQVGPLWV